MPLNLTQKQDLVKEMAAILSDAEVVLTAVSTTSASLKIAAISLTRSCFCVRFNGILTPFLD